MAGTGFPRRLPQADFGRRDHRTERRLPGAASNSHCRPTAGACERPLTESAYLAFTRPCHACPHSPSMAFLKGIQARQTAPQEAPPLRPQPLASVDLRKLWSCVSYTHE